MGIRFIRATIMKTSTLLILFLILISFSLPSCASSSSRKPPDHNVQISPPNNVRIIPMHNPAQPFELAAKLQWNPHNQAWDKVLVLYNGNTKPPSNHPIWNYLNNLRIPQRGANKPGENLHYKAFHSYAYCTGETALTRGNHLNISFDKNSLGAYTQKDFSKDWNCASWQMGRRLVSIVQGKKAHQGKGLQLHFPKGSSGCGKDCINWKPSLGGKFNKIRYSYWLKLPNNFDFKLGGKLPGIGNKNANTGGNKPNGYDGWSVRAMWNKQGQLGQYVYHVDQSKEYGEFMQWNMPAISKGQWHHIQTTVKLNTPKQFNGIIQTTVDGKQVLNKENLRFRMVSGLEIERFLFSSFFGGSGKQWAPTKDEVLYLDDFVISR